jgi:hypothetical protein
MSRILRTAAVGTAGRVPVQASATAGSGRGQVEIAVHACPPHCCPLWDCHACSQCENSPSPWLPPLPAQPIPEASQRVGMGPRDQARWLPPDGPTRRQSGSALHPWRLRLVRQVSLDSRLPAVASGPLHHRGRGSGLVRGSAGAGYSSLVGPALDRRDALRANRSDLSREDALLRRQAKPEPDICPSGSALQAWRRTPFPLLPWHV